MIMASNINDVKGMEIIYKLVFNDKKLSEDCTNIIKKMWYMLLHKVCFFSALCCLINQELGTCLS